MSDLSGKLRELRGSSSQAEMARQLGMKQPQWARYESGASSPSVEILQNICRIHAVSADWLLCLDKSCNGRNFSVRASSGGIAIGGNVSGSVVTAGTSPACSKCPFKKKLQALEKLLNK